MFVTEDAEVLARMWIKLAQIRALCEENQVPAAGGGMCDAEAIWPSRILEILDS